MIHESAHLYNGHLDWIKNCEKKPAAFIDDFPDVVIPKGDLIRHFFEIDADNCALQITLFNSIYLSSNAREDLSLSELERKVRDIAFGTIKRMTSAVVYSLYVLFRSTDPGPWDEKTIGFRSHPRELVRARYMLVRYWEVLNLPGFAPSDVSTLYVAIAATENAEADIANMVGRPSDIKSFEKIMTSKLAIKHIEEIGKLQWRLTPELKPYVRGDKYPRLSGEELKGKASKPYVEL